ncbi:hypothetical protein DVH24_007502 [Malus domestica]|uniref:Repressor of RNA polymerase III transcription n=1 Tax=Malus domestica TaxID=3750 RepID=A0A498HFJ4_MALDO|nr:hypothetical protein DVH24_007502 [Malus domestica]
MAPKSNYKKQKGRTQCTRLPLYARSRRGECRLTLPPFMKRLLPSLEPETYRSWTNALAIAPITKNKEKKYIIFINHETNRFHKTLKDLLFLLNDFFSDLNLGERTIQGCLEAYSCKHTGSDKKLSLGLENEILDYLGKSSDSDSSSPAEFLLTRSSRKTLIYLVLTLYHLYPDYDFSAVNAHQFFTEESWDSFKQIFDTYMFEASKEWTETNEGSSLLEALYKALDEVVRLAECEVYSYSPDSDADPFLERGSINLVADGFLMDKLRYDEDGEIFDNMDI